MNYIQVSIATKDTTTREVLVAQLAELGFESFEENDTHLHAYALQEVYEQQTVDELLEPYELKAEISVMEQRNWNEEWEKGFSPVRVDDFCTIRATFHEADTAVTHDIIVTPKMSFGTGHHATTQLMVRQMKMLDFAGKRVLDFGSGTGVLAILAEKMGAKAIVAIDNDEWSYENALENAAHNNARVIEVLRGSLPVAGTEKYDIILANINRHILLEYMQDMKALLTTGGVVLMSGILVEDETLIASEAGKAGLKLTTKTQLENWLCLSFC